jgi:hypothetical protein
VGDGTTTMRSAPVDVWMVTSGAAAVGTGDGHSCALMAAGDVLCWGLNTSGQVGDGTTTTRLAPTAVVGLRATVSDFNADGQADILWHNQTDGALFVWFMNGAERTGGGYPSPSSVSTDWQVRGVADFNVDGKPDLLWHNQTDGALYVWFMDGVQRTGGGYVNPPNVSTDWQIRGVADLNADRKPDILWRNLTDGALYVWFMDGVERTGGGYLNSPNVSMDWQIRGVTDLDADGKPDILWHNQTDGSLYAWFMDGVERTGGGYLNAPSVSTDWQIGQVADFDADGRPEILWHNQTHGTLYVWFMNGVERTGGGYLSPSIVSSDWQIRR